MPRIKRYKLAHKLATVAAGGATLAAAMGQLPARAAYGPPPPPPPPGGYHNVVTSQTCGPAGCVITAWTDGLLVSVTVPPGEFSKPAQITLLAPNARGIGTGIHPCLRAVGGAGIVVQINGKTDTGTFAKPFTVEISGREIRPADQVAEWNGTSFFSCRLVGGPADRGPGRGRTTVSSRSGFLGHMVLEGVFCTPAGGSLAGIGVLSPEWLAARSH